MVRTCDLLAFSTSYTQVPTLRFISRSQETAEHFRHHRIIMQQASAQRFRAGAIIMRDMLHVPAACPRKSG
jgi:hypothetical protein